MLEFRKKKRIRKIIYSPIALLFLCLIFVLLVKGVFSLYKKEKSSNANLVKEQVELGKLVLREKTLASSIDYLKTEQGMENEIRTKFRAVKENEMVAVIIDNQASTTVQATTTEDRGFWYNLFH